jgi:hypothetical protein
VPPTSNAQSLSPKYRFPWGWKLIFSFPTGPLVQVDFPCYLLPRAYVRRHQ